MKECGYSYLINLSLLFPCTCTSVLTMFVLPGYEGDADMILIGDG